VSGLRIQIGVARAGIVRHKAQAQIGETIRIIGATRNVARKVDHLVVDT
jgi:hypothetical protein